MDETLPSCAEDGYRCPGETRSIDRAAHLGRLAAFYPACRACQHRGDARLLSSPQARQWADILRRAPREARWSAEGFECSSPNDLDGPLARRLARLLAQNLLCHRDPRATPPAVIVASDAHWSTAEPVAFACEALQHFGCRAIESGAETSASLAVLSEHARADAAMWIGAAMDAARTPLVRFWGAQGRPWSAPGDLDPLAQQDDDGTGARPRRGGGGLERAGARNVYLAPLTSMFHALRPIRLVLDTTSAALLANWRQLAGNSACEMIPARRADSALIGHGAASRGEDSSFGLGHSVVSHRADFGIWIDGDGEALSLVDEQGAPVSSARLACALVEYIAQAQPDAVVVLDAHVERELAREMAERAGTVASAFGSRQAMFDTLVLNRAAFGVGGGGRFWYGGQPPTCDALMTLALLLVLLSQSDRPLSRVLDGAASAL